MFNIILNQKKFFFRALNFLETVKLADENKEFVIGFICQSRVSPDPAMISITPGFK